MSTNNLAEIANQMVAPGKGILAADESSGTIQKRLDSIGVESTEENRRAYRELLFTTGGIEEYISGVILFDETLRQSAADGTNFGALLASRGILPGIKVDKGAKDLAFAPGEKVTEGLDGLRERLAEYVSLGATFTKWRAVITIGEGIPSAHCIEANAHGLARYAALSQEAGLVPIVEPEVLMDADNTIEVCEEVTNETLESVFHALHLHRVSLEGMILKPNMVISGKGMPGPGGRGGSGRGHGALAHEKRARRRARHLLPLGRTERRGRHRALERDERDGPPPLGAQLLLRPRAAGAGSQGLGRRGGERAPRPEALPPPVQVQRRREDGSV